MRGVKFYKFLLWVFKLLLVLGFCGFLFIFLNLLSIPPDVRFSELSETEIMGLLFLALGVVVFWVGVLIHHLIIDDFIWLIERENSRYVPEEEG